jgi:hypothetical protein
MRCNVHLGLRVGSQDVWHDCSDPEREIECLTLIRANLCLQCAPAQMRIPLKFGQAVGE